MNRLVAIPPDFGLSPLLLLCHRQKRSSSSSSRGGGGEARGRISIPLFLHRLWRRSSRTACLPEREEKRREGKREGKGGRRRSKNELFRFSFFISFCRSPLLSHSSFRSTFFFSYLHLSGLPGCKPKAQQHVSFRRVSVLRVCASAPRGEGGELRAAELAFSGGGGASESSMGAEQKERDRELDRLLKVQAAAKLFRPPATAPLGLASRFFSPTARAVGSPPGVRVGVETGKRQKAAGRARACSFFCARPSNLLVGRRRASMGALLEIEKKSHPNVASQRPCERSIGPHLSRDVWNLIFPRRRDR